MRKNLSRVMTDTGMMVFVFLAMVSCKKNIKPTEKALTTTPRAATYSLIWDDEFKGTSLNTSNWNIDVGNPGVNNEQEYYQASNVTETGGNLVITANQQTVAGQPY